MPSGMPDFMHGMGNPRQHLTEALGHGMFLHTLRGDSQIFFLIYGHLQIDHQEQLLWSFPTSDYL